MINVVHAIYCSNNEYFSNIPNEYQNLLNCGIVKNPSITKKDNFVETLNRFFNFKEDLEYRGSMYTVRAVLPNRDFDDSRPTIIEEVDNGVFTIFSGKIGTCVDSAYKLYDKILETDLEFYSILDE